MHMNSSKSHLGHKIHDADTERFTLYRKAVSSREDSPVG